MWTRRNSNLSRFSRKRKYLVTQVQNPDLTVIALSNPSEGQEIVNYVEHQEEDDGDELSMKSNLFCMMEDNPMAMYKAAKDGNVEKFTKLYEKNPEKLKTACEGPLLFSPLHIAASKGHVGILSAVDSEHLNLRDREGNTPLHVASGMGVENAIEVLLNRGATTIIQNCEGYTPLQYAVCCRNVEGVVTLLRHKDKVNPNDRGRKGYTALHIAASFDLKKISKLLLDNGASACIRADNHLFAAHIAAQNSSTGVLECILEYAESKGMLRSTIMKYLDNEGMNPLHYAVYGRNMDTLEFCLKNGGRLTCQQEDGCTPLHLACAQGDAEMVEKMFELSPEDFIVALHMKDIGDKTPLHHTANVENEFIINFLLEHGADIEATDKVMSTPLILSAMHSCWNNTVLLVKMGANIYHTDEFGRNCVHILVLKNGSIFCLGKQLPDKIYELLEGRDMYGCTPMHYATKAGYLRVMKELFDLGAKVNVLNKSKETPLHFAARNGRYETSRRLLDSEVSHILINAKEGEGLTALHLAVQGGHTKVMHLLRSRGALICKSDDGDTPLHLGASEGNIEVVVLLVQYHSYLLSSENKRKFTPICMAAFNNQADMVRILLDLDSPIKVNENGDSFFTLAFEKRFCEVVTVALRHRRWEEILDAHADLPKHIMLSLIEVLPDCAQIVLDRCITYAPLPHDENKICKKYNFRYIQSSKDEIRRTMDEGTHRPLKIISSMVKHERVDCLSHPLCQRYLDLQWLNFGMWIHATSLILYSVFIALFTYFIMNNNPIAYRLTNCPKENISETCGYERKYFLTRSNAEIVALINSTIFCFGNIIKEFFQMMHLRIKYFKDFQNYCEWLLYLSTLLFVIPMFWGSNDEFQWHFGCIAIFLSWFNLFLYQEKMAFFGIYVLMFIQILKTLAFVLFMFTSLFVAFGLSFHILMADSASYSVWWMSIYKTVVMMTGELEFTELFVSPALDGDGDTFHYPILSMCLLFIFILLMPLLIVNLLIGLAVGDISGILKNAKLRRLALQVDFYCDYESRMRKGMLLAIHRETDIQFPGLLKCAAKSIKTENFMWRDKLESQQSVREPVDMEDLYNSLRDQQTKFTMMENHIDKIESLVKLVVEKMEINTEASQFDEGLAEISVEKKYTRLDDSTEYRSRNLARTVLNANTFIRSAQKHKDK